MHPSSELYTKVSSKAGEIEAELKRLDRWESAPLPPEKFEDMGAFGSNTMLFEQWLQFILIPRIKSIVNEKDEFPDESMLSPYAIRYFDGDTDIDDLHQILYDLDALINGAKPDTGWNEMEPQPAASTIFLGDTTLPPVMNTLADLLPDLEGDPLESQLQSFDTFLSVLATSVRPVISQLLMETARKTSNPSSRQRIEAAATSILQGGRAAEPYNHEEAMKKFQEHFRKSYPQGGLDTLK